MVTGGAGFIGSHIADLLIENHYNVIIVDNLSTGSKKNLNKKAVFFECDLNDADYLKTIFKENQIDYVIHEAAQINLRNSIKDPVFDATQNILGSISLFERCKESNIKKIVFASSGGAIYGEPAFNPVNEVHPTRPLSPYAIAKLAAEKYLYYYWKVHGLDHVILRYANVFGPRQDPKGEAGVVSIFTNKMLKGEQPMIFGTGKQSRDFVFVRDVAMANLFAVQKIPKNNQKKIFNISSNQKRTILEVYEAIKKITHFSKEPLFEQAIAGEIMHIFLDNTLFRTETGWDAATGFEKGIEETIEWIKQNTN